MIAKPWKRLWSEDLLPYRKLRRDLPFVMVAHAAYPAGDRRPHSGVAVEEMDERYPAQEDRLSWADHHRRSRHGRSAGGSLDRRCCGRNPSRGADMFSSARKKRACGGRSKPLYKRAESDKKFAKLIAEKVETSARDAKKKSNALEGTRGCRLRRKRPWTG